MGRGLGVHGGDFGQDPEEVLLGPRVVVRPARPPATTRRLKLNPRENVLGNDRELGLFEVVALGEGKLCKDGSRGEAQSRDPSPGSDSHGRLLSYGILAQRGATLP